jgi:hypothetical protein
MNNCEGKTKLPLSKWQITLHRSIITSWMTIQKKAIGDFLINNHIQQILKLIRK